MSDRIYLSPPHLSGTELDRLGEALDSNWIAPLGPQVDAFERELADVVGVRNALVTSSGTAALHLALDAVGVVTGDVVIGATFTFIGSVSPVRSVGAEPWFVDADSETWTIDVDLVEEALLAARTESRNVGAVIAVDLFGQCADYQRLEALCSEFNVPLIEDAAESLGATYRNRGAGSFGRVGILSFNGNKIITTSGGGALVSDDSGLIDRCRFLATQAREPAMHYEHAEIGYNYRMSNLLAAVGRAQLDTLDQRVASKRRVFDTYASLLGGVDGLEFMPEASYGTSNRWLTAMTVDPERFGATREDLIGALEAQNIEARPVWKPMHRQPVFAESRVFGGLVSEELFDVGICLPSGVGLGGDDIERIASIILSVP